MASMGGAGSMSIGEICTVMTGASCLCRNGRLAMVGLLAVIALEMVTGQGVFRWALNHLPDALSQLEGAIP